MSTERRGAIPRSERTISNAKMRELKKLYAMGALERGGVIVDLSQITNLPTTSENGNGINVINNHLPNMKRG